MSARPDQSPTFPNALLPEANLATFIGAVPHAIILVNSERRIALANEVSERLFGYPKDGLLGKSIETLFSPHLKHQVTGHFNAQPNSGHAEKTAELIGIRNHGPEFPLTISSRPLHTEAGSFTLSAIQDLTSSKNLQQELNEKTAALENARQEFQAFSHSISHDLRAPLRAMDGFAAALKRSLDGNITKDAGHAVNRIQENATRMSKLIDGLLDYSALSWLAMTKKKFQPGNIAQKCFDGLSANLNNHPVNFSVGELPDCEADMALVRRVFDNLLSNAIKFSHQRAPAVIHVGSRKQDGEVVYFVQDNGVGFDMEYSGKLFHVFQRLHSPSEFEGTGMGLAIVHRIVQRHGGRIWAEGAVDRGATFYFTLGDSGHGHSA